MMWPMKHKRRMEFYEKLQAAERALILDPNDKQSLEDRKIAWMVLAATATTEKSVDDYVLLILSKLLECYPDDYRTIYEVGCIYYDTLRLIRDPPGGDHSAKRLDICNIALGCFKKVRDVAHAPDEYRNSRMVDTVEYYITHDIRRDLSAPPIAAVIEAEDDDSVFAKSAPPEENKDELERMDIKKMVNLFQENKDELEKMDIEKILERMDIKKMVTETTLMVKKKLFSLNLDDYKAKQGVMKAGAKLIHHCQDSELPAFATSTSGQSVTQVKRMKKKKQNKGKDKRKKKVKKQNKGKGC